VTARVLRPVAPVTVQRRPGVAPAGPLPTILLLGLEGGMSTSAAVAQLSALARDFPGAAEQVAARVAVTALDMIAAGHNDPARLARHCRTVCAAAGGRWTANHITP
jgi:hypothetical protein